MVGVTQVWGHLPKKRKKPGPPGTAIRPLEEKTTLGRILPRPRVENLHSQFVIVTDRGRKPPGTGHFSRCPGTIRPGASLEHRADGFSDGDRSSLPGTGAS